ncbi:flagellar export protein FliJ [Jeongeupia naejangsanensis]|uniref:Flagellar FliJ protein n=1 Tax=Jeongeupia naejangsanensis TaxID=613195 RepID=A0ABS2BI02_9NEIS|nr:flagellar export protein FliJ [Jeongeupia naejangsanensis]MBM3115231.1 flagellar export protein FliJ [Jeongeupia naejangsanensis]
MAKFRFEFLLELATDAREREVKVLQAAQAAEQGARDRLVQIQHYCDEYRRKLTLSAQSGMTVVQFRDYQLFLGKLDDATKQQLAEVARLVSEREAALARFNECEKKLKAYETLKVRHGKQQDKLELQREQKLLDEFNSRPR